MTLEPMNARMHLQNIHCYDEGDGAGSAEPYLWTVFFNIDGSTVSAKIQNGQVRLEGSATVVGTPGNQDNLPNHDTDPGENIGIPTALGLFQTELSPIILTDFNLLVTGDIGGVMILMEEDNTPNSAIAKGHHALNAAMQPALNGLIKQIDEQIKTIPLNDLKKDPRTSQEKYFEAHQG